MYSIYNAHKSVCRQICNHRRVFSCVPSLTVPTPPTVIIFHVDIDMSCSWVSFQNIVCDNDNITMTS